MRWFDLYSNAIGQPRAIAALMAAAWNAVADWPDESVAQTLAINQNDPSGVFNVLDWRGIPTPQPAHR